jgi:bisphosphoglycerate-dependent phosphoglycerate mutase
MTVNLICSHQNRIQCLLAALEKESDKLKKQNEIVGGVFYDYQKYQEAEPVQTQADPVQTQVIPTIKKIRFKNGAILHVKFNTPDLLTVSMVYQGELGEKDNAKRLANEKPYYGIDVAQASRKKTKMRTNYLSWKNEPTHFKGDVTFEPKTFKTSHKYSDEFECYLIRHGEADHNVNKIGPFSKRKTWYDTDLTEIGKAQAKKSAEALAAHFKTRGITFNKMRFFASDLMRTFLTLNAFKEQFQSALSDDIKMYLLPCSHEVKSEKSNCDKKEAWGWFTSPENKPVWSNLEKNSTMMDTRRYREFYPSGIRESRTISRTLRCRNTNMLILADDIIQNEVSNPHKLTPLKRWSTHTQPTLFTWDHTGGRTRRRKRSRKQRK